MYEYLQKSGIFQCTFQTRMEDIILTDVERSIHILQHKIQLWATTLPQSHQLLPGLCKESRIVSAEKYH